MSFDAAIAKRQSLLNTATDSLRLLDGAGDGISDCYLDTYAERWLVSTQGPRLPRHLDTWLRDQGQQGRCIYHKRLDQQEKESPSHLYGPTQDEPFFIKENGLSYEISFHSGYSQGIFLDQRDNRAEVIKRSSSGQRVLNTFSYTGAFSVCAASAGATATTLDLSQPYLDWARRNFQANDLDDSDHYFCKGDTFHWLQRFARQGRTFDGIILDPPTFARDHKGKVFRIEKDYGRLVQLAHSCLAPDGWILACTNYRRMDTNEFKTVLKQALPHRAKLTSSDMPADYTDTHYLKSVWIS